MPNNFFELAVPTSEGFRDVEPRALHEAQAPLRLIDVREPDEFLGELGHVAGAELVPLGTLIEAATDWPLERAVVLVCRSGGRSSKAARELVARGFSQVMNLRGGMLAWNAAGLPVVR